MRRRTNEAGLQIVGPGLNVDVLAVGIYRDEAHFVGAEDFRMMSGEPVKKLLMRVMKQIIGAVGNEREIGPDRVEKRRGAGCLAAVMPHF